MNVSRAWTNIFLGSIFVVLMASLVMLLYIDVGIGKLNSDSKITRDFVDEGCVQRIGKDSVMINGRIHSNICDDDLGLIRIGDGVIIEKSEWFFGCDIYRVIVQESQSCG